ncbi:MAG: DUF1304 domain-containing protein [Segniliparus sp.]|uniref:DUF1304 domain-containing protein n=1 Tax=Segniliparus sp. TaxID=2804064 RepID=UPI003F2F59E6
MFIAFEIFAALAALLHVAIFLMESVLWSKPQIYGRFGVRSAEDADVIKPMAYNQGFYNLFLAIGIFVGLAAPRAQGEILVVFALSCIVGAALVLLSTGLSYLRAAVSQAAFATIALALWALLPA